MSFFLKISGGLLIAFIMLFAFNIVILQGGVFVQRISVMPKRARFAADEKNPQTENGARDRNLKIKKFTVVSKSPDSFFRKNQSIEVSCILENAGQENLKNFRSLVRTPEKEIASAQTKILKNAEQIVLSGSFTPENSGVLIVACRGDIEKRIEEINENDNREVTALYIQ